MMVHCRRHQWCALRQMDVMALLSAVLVRHVLTLLRLVQATAALARLA